MEPSRFDSFARFFASRRSTRRRALIAAAGGAMASGLARGHVAADEASPTPGAAPDAVDRPHFMFVQMFGAGSIDAATDGVPMLLLQADHLAGQTLYFSDRPERIVGMVPTEQLLGSGGRDDGLGFTLADPPNAALVLPDGRLMVVELIEPQYDPATGQVRYQLRILDDLTQVDLDLDTAPSTVAEITGDFTAASLFIDDCPDGQIVCWGLNGPVGRIPSGGNTGFCWDSNDLCCLPCDPPSVGRSWDATCNATYADCNGGCSHSYTAAFSCANE